MHPSRIVVTAVLLLAIPACQEQPTDVEASGHLQLLVVSGEGQKGPSFTQLTEPIVVRVVRGDTPAGVPNQIVNFVVTEGGGSVFAGAAITDHQGYAAERWTLGGPGPQALEARAVSADGEELTFGEFTARASGVLYDEAAFLSTSGATAAFTFSVPRGPTVFPYYEHGNVLYSPSASIWVQDHTPIFDGNELATSGPENVDVFFYPSVSVGLWMQDGFNVGNVEADVGGGFCPKQDSQFEFTFKNEATGTIVYTLTEDPPVDEAFFWGVILPEVAHKLEIREVGSACENDFISTIYTGS
jgi:hypothetical protein